MHTIRKKSVPVGVGLRRRNDPRGTMPVIRYSTFCWRRIAMTRRRVAILIGSMMAAVASSRSEASAVTLQGEIVEETSGKPLAARLYIQHADGRWFFAKSMDA